MDNVEKIRKFIQEHNLPIELIILNKSTATSELAAKALKCDISQIAKSILIICNEPIIVVISGDKKVNLKKLSNILNCKARIAKPEEVEKYTGFKVGGVPPFGFNKSIRIFLDKSLERFDFVYAAGGETNAIIKVPVNILKSITKGEIIDVSYE